jgi:hypothetical protein
MSRAVPIARLTSQIQSPVPMRRFIQRVKLVLLTGAAQALVQLIGFAAGLVVVRLLPAQQYAYFTISAAVLGSMTVLGDSGVANGVLSQGGPVWQDRSRLGAVLSGGLRLRTRISAVVAFVGAVMLFLLLDRQGAPRGQSLSIVAATVGVFLSGSPTSVLEVAVRLAQKLTPLQLNQALINAGRLIFTAALVPLLPNAAVAQAATFLPVWWGTRRLRRLVQPLADIRCQPTRPVQAALRAQVRRALPDSVYYSLSGQLTVWLIALFGKSSAVAAVGALGRLAMLIAVLLTTFHILVVPRFARLDAASAGRIGRRYWQAQALMVVACGVPLLAFALIPQYLVDILGPTYTHLGPEALIMAAGATTGTMAGAAFHLGAARGITVPPTFLILANVAAQAVLVVLLPVDTVRGVLWLGFWGGAFQWAVYTGYFVMRHRSRL